MCVIARLKRNLTVVYSNEKLPTSVNATLFLAGPSSRVENHTPWRQEAVKILKRVGYQDTIYVPEPNNGTWPTYERQVTWELDALRRADVIVFWIPRSDELPGFTTNVEFGFWVQSGRVVLGAPEDAPHLDYLRALAQRYNVPIFTSLPEIIKAAIAKVGEGAIRVGGEVTVPLLIWQTPSFQAWYQNQVDAGNTLTSAVPRFVHLTGPNKDIVFLWLMDVDVYIQAEDRHKVNEFVISRTDTSAVMLYLPGKTLRDTKVILVREFRSPVSNAAGFVYELSGGSSLKPEEDALTVASHEVYEELGFKLSPSRFRYVGTRQGMATLLANRIHLYAAEISPAELRELQQLSGEPHGNVEDTERTYIEIQSVGELLNAELVDWSNVGMILSVLEEIHD